MVRLHDVEDIDVLEQWDEDFQSNYIRDSLRTGNITQPLRVNAWLKNETANSSTSLLNNRPSDSNDIFLLTHQEALQSNDTFGSLRTVNFTQTSALLRNSTAKSSTALLNNERPRDADGVALLEQSHEDLQSNDTLGSQRTVNYTQTLETGSFLSNETAKRLGTSVNNETANNSTTRRKTSWIGSVMELAHADSFMLLGGMTTISRALLKAIVSPIAANSSWLFLGSSSHTSKNSLGFDSSLIDRGGTLEDALKGKTNTYLSLSSIILGVLLSSSVIVLGLYWLFSKTSTDELGTDTARERRRESDEKQEGEEEDFKTMRKLVKTPGGHQREKRELFRGASKELQKALGNRVSQSTESLKS